MPTIRYLAYGSNLYPARLGARVAGVTSLGISALPGWALRFHKSSADGSGKCNLIRDPAATAYGAVYEISLADKQRLDTIEGAGVGYQDVRIELTAYGGVYVYLAEPSHINDHLQPYDWYHAFVIAGARHHRFPDTYIAQIARVDSLRDPDDARRSRNQAILAAK